MSLRKGRRRLRCTSRWVDLHLGCQGAASLHCSSFCVHQDLERLREVLVQTGQECTEPEMMTSSHVSCMTVTAGSRSLVLGCCSGDIEMYNLKVPPLNAGGNTESAIMPITSSAVSLPQRVAEVLQSACPSESPKYCSLYLRFFAVWRAAAIVAGPRRRRQHRYMR